MSSWQTCASCRFLDVCGGNFRVRAEATTGDLWSCDPACYLTDEEIGIEAGSPEALEAAEWPVPIQKTAEAVS